MLLPDNAAGIFTCRYDSPVAISINEAENFIPMKDEINELHLALKISKNIFTTQEKMIERAVQYFEKLATHKHGIQITQYEPYYCKIKKKSFRI